MDFKRSTSLAGTRSLLAAIIAVIFYASASASIKGELDNNFQPQLMQDNQAIGNAVLIQPDGKVLYAGLFLTVNRQPQSYITRFNADGTLDQGFDTGNTFTFAASINAIALQPDGKIVVAGSFDTVGGTARTNVARLNADGSFDPTFAVPFAAGTGSITSVATQPDGKVLIGGSFSTIGGVARSGFARLNNNGTLDTAFVTPCSAPGDKAILVQPDGKIVVGNSCGIASNPGVALLTSSGTLDTAFNAGTGSNGSAVTSLAMQADGKIFVGGRFSSFNGQPRKGVVRLTSTGALDPTFVGATDYGTYSIFLQADGKVLIARDFGFQGVPSINRLNNDGSIDTSFNATQTQVNNIFAVAATADGTVYEAGKMVADGPNFSTVARPFLRLTSAGLIDNTFDPYVAYPSLSAGINNVVPQPDGKIIVAGQFRDANRVAKSALVRFNADGTLDTGFNLGANTVIANGSVFTVVLQPDGKILVGSDLPTDDNTRLVRLNPDGSRDASFNVAVNDSVKFIALQPDGRILVAGNFTVIGGQTRNAHFARLNANGTVDAFDPAFGGQNYVSSLIVQPDGKFVIGGNFSTVNGVNRGTSARFNADGTLDSSFANTDFGFSIANYAAIQPDGKFILLTPGTLVRYNADNTPDPSFTAPGFRVTGNNAGSINSVVVQANGKLLVGGQFDFINVSGFPVRKNIARLNADGSLDVGFGTYGGATGGNVNKVAIQADGRILIGGVFKMVNGFGHSGLARLNQSILQANRFSDFDGDGITDVSVYRGGQWFVDPSSGASAPPIYGFRFGLATDKLAPADYDGDGKTDIAVWREGGSGGQAYFYIMRSSTGTLQVEPFGLTGDTILPGDWDGDGKADVATYREGAQSFFYYRGSRNNPSGATTYIPWGIGGDKATRGDFDGDGLLDAAVYRSLDRTWYIKGSSNGQVIARQFGLETDTRVPADYDGDGRTDIAVVRSGVWYILQSSDDQVKYRSWGVAGDTLTPGDYDGDGRTDSAVFRGGITYIQNTSNAAAVYKRFGTTGDIVAASAYIQ